MTYIDDKHQKHRQTSKKHVTYQTPARKYSTPAIILFILLAIVAILALISAISMDTRNANNGVSMQEGEENSMADKDRKSTLASVVAAISTYQANNRGAMPGTSDKWSQFWNEYVGTLADSTGTTYKLAAACEYGEQNTSCTKPSSLSWKNNHHEIYIVTKATCNSDGTNIEPVNRSRGAAVYTVTSTDQAICVSN